jgi:hypothetical protein
MPGAITGTIKSIDANEGIIYTERSEIYFTNESDALKVNQ